MNGSTSGDETPPQNKVLVIGFDGLDFSYLDRFSDSLEHFSRLRKRGVEAPLESTTPPLTPMAWPSLYTGTGPGDHGIYSFLHFDSYPDNCSLVNYANIGTPAIWEYLSTVGERSVVLNVPLTHPVSEIDGVVVPGFLSPEDASGHPDGIIDELRSELENGYEIYPENFFGGQHNSIDDVDRFLTHMDTKISAAKYLLSERSWEFAFVQIQLTDTVFHVSDDDSHFRSIYEKSDELVGELTSLVSDDTNVVVCSDHGMSSPAKEIVHVNQMLFERGLCVATDDGAPSPSMWTEIDDIQGETSSSESEDGPSTEQTTVDWRRSKAFCRAPSEFGVRINLEGRESDGVVKRDEYEDVRDEIIAALDGVTDDDGNDVFELVARREEVYDGESVEQAPDVVFMTTDFAYPISTDIGDGSEVVREQQFETHHHGKNGVFIARGPDIDDSYAGNSIEITDVAPLVMGMLRNEVPESMTGSVPPGLLCDEVVETSYQDATTTDERDAEKHEDVRSRLEDLGYL